MIVQPNPSVDTKQPALRARSTPDARAVPPILVDGDARANRRPSRRRTKPRVMKLVRRVHLYLGLALLPWVLLYGVTALLFNHSDWMSESVRYELSAADLAGARFEGLPEPGVVASKAFERLESMAAGSDFELLADSARWLGRVSLSGKSDEVSVFASLDPEGRGGSLRVTPEDDGELPAWAAGDFGDWAPMSSDERQALSNAALDLAARHHIELDSALTRRLPEVRFLVREGEEVYACDVALDGELDIQPAAEVSTLRRKLLRLHVQHGDPGFNGVQRVWALVVDVMGIAMVLWGASGIVMWWTIRPTRVAGTVAMASGVVAIVVLGASLWHAIGSVA